VSPLGLKQLLKYMESNGEGASVRPWVWIMWIFIGPVVSSLANEHYLYITGRTMIRTEAIITQLVFEHSLRIRMKVDSDVFVGIPEPSAGLASNGDQRKNKGWSSNKAESTSHNVMGKINNLVTTDLGNITDARDFLYAGLCDSASLRDYS
jgi:hypothetical protein